MRRSLILATMGLACGRLCSAGSILLNGGTIVAFDQATESLKVIRNGSVLITNDRIVSVGVATLVKNDSDTTVIDVSGKIVTPGFIDTHRHGWQTIWKTIASNTTLGEYFGRYGEFAAAGKLTADDVYISQLAGLYEALNAGVTTTLDHAHHTWSDQTAEAGLKASVDSGARVFWSYAFHNVTGYNVSQQIPNFRTLASNPDYKNSSTEIGIAYDFFGPSPNVAEANQIWGLAKEFNASVITTHSLQGPWGFTNSPEDVQTLGFLNDTIPFVFSHASFLTAQGSQLLRSTNQYISITPESEMHYGHTHPVSHLIQDQAAIGVDTHFTYSTDILTQARIWLQSARYTLYYAVTSMWRAPSKNPQSVNQAFLLATRHGGLALRRQDIGVIAPGAKADVLVWSGRSPSMLGWLDPVAAVMLHANVGDIEHVLVDGVFKKKDGKLVVEGYDAVQEKFLAAATRLQDQWVATPLPVLEGDWQGFPFEQPLIVDTLRGPGDGYGEQFLSRA